MDRRTFVCGMGAAALGAAAESEPAPPGRPNILFFFTDQQRWDTVDCYGRPLFPGLTPNLDAMAREGVRFDQAFTCQPVCGPARSCLMTGRWATQTGCWRNDIALPAGEPTLATMLGQAGYRTGYVGKWHLASSGEKQNVQARAVPHELRGGFKDAWMAADVLEFTSHGYGGHVFDAEGRQVDFPDGRYRPDALTDYALRFLEEQDGERPWFLFLSYLEPHHQNDRNHFEGPEGSKQAYAGFRTPGDLAPLKGNWAEEMPDYLGACAALDRNLGRLRDALRKRKMLDNTLVVFTSDHGCHFRTRNNEYKRSCHDGSIRIPMVLRGPGFRRGRVVRDPVSLIDLPPTLLAAAGVAPVTPMGGAALQPVAAGSERRSDVFLQISESQVGRAVRTRRWKYAVQAPGKRGWVDSAADSYRETHLYDLKADPDELHNLVADPAHARTRAEMAALLIRRMREAGEAAPAILPAR